MYYLGLTPITKYFLILKGNARTMMEKVITELLRIKKIYHPWSHFKERYRHLVSFRKAKGVEVGIETLRIVSEMLDVPPSFLLRINRYDRFEEMEK